MAPHSSRFHSCNLPVNSCAGPEHITVTYFYLHRVVTGSLISTATTSFIVAHAFHSAYFEPRESPYPFLFFRNTIPHVLPLSRHVFLVLQGCQPKDGSFPQRISHVFRSRISPCRNSYVYTGARGRRPRSQRRQTGDQVIRESR